MFYKAASFQRKLPICLVEVKRQDFLLCTITCGEEIASKFRSSTIPQFGYKCTLTLKLVYIQEKIQQNHYFLDIKFLMAGY